MRYSYDPWSQFSRSLEWYGDRLRELKYEPLAAVVPTDFKFFQLGKGQLALEDIQSLLNSTPVGPPHGFELLQPLPIPDFPDFPESPPVPPKPKPVRSWLFGNTVSPTDPSYEFTEKTIKRAEELGRQVSSLGKNSKTSSRRRPFGYRNCGKPVRPMMLVPCVY